ncbi:MAG: hypothetical protein VKK62_10050 [Synechococcaceae cyanobacterium]|nr:hypothetical protein [Synechococcaceae cyanobacterium]
MADDQPITPHAAPSLDAAGQLSYTGDDGLRYVVGVPLDTDDAGVERVMEDLRRANSLYRQIEGLCRAWIAAVQGRDLDRGTAMVLLLTTLETTLEDPDPEGAGDS